MKLYGFEPARLNNVPEDQIFDVLRGLFAKMLENPGHAIPLFSDKERDDFLRAKEEESLRFQREVYAQTERNFERILNEFEMSILEQFPEGSMSGEFRAMVEAGKARLRQQMETELASLANQIEATPDSSTEAKLSEKKLNPKSFEEFMELMYKLSPGSGGVIDKIPLDFNVLDSFGYYPDNKKRRKKEKRGSYWMEMWDSNHLTYAIGCSYFVTQDSGFYARSKAVLLRHNIPLKILSIGEAIEELSSVGEEDDG